MTYSVTSNAKYSKLVNFASNLDAPIHDWFNLKEGYSAKLISELISDLKVEKGIIFDPFSGCGTTLLAAKRLGFDYLGFEVNPFLYTLAKTKLFNYDDTVIKKIKDYKSKIKSRVKQEDAPRGVKLSIAKKAFGSQLNIILKYRSVILRIRNEEVRNFFLIAFLSVLENCSSSKKDGNGLRYPKNKVASNFLNAFNEKIEKMINDIEKVRIDHKSDYVFNSDSRNIESNILKRFKGKSKLSIFSPPYLNCFDYTEIYKIELWFGNFIQDYNDLKSIRHSSLTSHLNKNILEVQDVKFATKFVKSIEKENIWSNKIPRMISNYFLDMKDVLENVHFILEKGGHCVIIVGNSAYGKIVIPTDEILAKIAETIGFKIKKIEVARTLNTSPQQQKKIKNKTKLRESLVYLEKC